MLPNSYSWNKLLPFHDITTCQSVASSLQISFSCNSEKLFTLIKFNLQLVLTQLFVLNFLHWRSCVVCFWDQMCQNYWNTNTNTTKLKQPNNVTYLLLFWFHLVPSIETFLQRSALGRQCLCCHGTQHTWKSSRPFQKPLKGVGPYNPTHKSSP